MQLLLMKRDVIRPPFPRICCPGSSYGRMACYPGAKDPSLALPRGPGCLRCCLLCHPAACPASLHAALPAVCAAAVHAACSAGVVGLALLLQATCAEAHSLVHHFACFCHCCLPNGCAEGTIACGPSKTQQLAQARHTGLLQGADPDHPVDDARKTHHTTAQHGVLGGSATVKCLYDAGWHGCA